MNGKKVVVGVVVVCSSINFYNVCAEDNTILQIPTAYMCAAVNQQSVIQAK